MEFTFMGVGQALGMAVSKAGGGSLQAVDYPTLRSALLAATEATPPVLPQVA